MRVELALLSAYLAKAKTALLTMSTFFIPSCCQSSRLDRHIERIAGPAYAKELHLLRSLRPEELAQRGSRRTKLPEQVYLTETALIREAAKSPRGDVEQQLTVQSPADVVELGRRTMKVISSELGTQPRGNRTAELLGSTFTLPLLSEEVLRRDTILDDSERRLLADRFARRLDSLPESKPLEAANWGVLEYSRQLAEKVVSDGLRAGSKWWNNRRSRRAAARKRGVETPKPPRYRLCAYAEFRMRNRERMQRFGRGPASLQKCDSPIMVTTKWGPPDYCCSKTCKRRLSRWRDNLRGTRPA